MGRKRKEAAAPETWRDIPGYDGRYQASTEGRIRKIWPGSGKRTMLTPYQRQRRKQANSDAYRVHIALPDGRRVERTVLGLVAETFYGSMPGRIKKEFALDGYSYRWDD